MSTPDSPAAALPHGDPSDYVEDGQVLIGCSRQGRDLVPECVELKLANRHGLITGATGTGKTVTLQVLAEGFSAAGVPVFAADIKGDLSGIAEQGRAEAEARASARKDIGLDRYMHAPARSSSGTSSASRAIRCAPPSRRWGRCCCRGCWS